MNVVNKLSAKEFSTIRKLLKKELTPQQMTLWIDPIEFERVAPSSFVLHFKRHFGMRWVESVHLPKIREALKKACKKTRVTISLKLDGNALFSSAL